MFFKILKDGKSCHGGDMQWSLPAKGPDGTWTPGEWHEIYGPLEICSRGFHVTDQPTEWWLSGCMAYVAEVAGELIHGDNKSVCRKVRLLAEATAEELASHRVYVTGTHKCNHGKCVACGNATVKAWGNSQAELWGNSQAVLRDNSQAVLRGNSQAELWDNSKAELWDNSKAVLWGNSTAIKFGNGNFAVGNYAVLIDRSQSPPKIVCGWEQ